MDVGESARRHAREFLEGHEEDRAILKGVVSREYHEAYERLLDHVHRGIHGDLKDWRKWAELRPAVLALVRSLCEELRRS